MKKPSKTEIRRIKIIEILVRGINYHYLNVIYPPNVIIHNPFTATNLFIEALNSYSDALTQQDIIKIRSSYFRGRDDPDLEKKISIEVSKTLRSLEEDGIITRTPVKISNTKGPAQNIVRLNTSPNTLYKILKEYNNPLFEGSDNYVNFLNLIHSKYYKNLVNMDLVNDLTSLLGFYLSKEDKNKIFCMVTASPRALYKLFSMAYEGVPTIPIFPKGATSENKKAWLYQNIELDFLNDYYKHLINDKYDIQADIKVKFKNNNLEEVFNFSENKIMFYVPEGGII